MYLRLAAIAPLSVLLAASAIRLATGAQGASSGGSVYLPYVVTSSPVTVAHTSSQVDSAGDVQIVGEVINNSGATIYGPVVDVLFYASNGAFIRDM